MPWYITRTPEIWDPRFHTYTGSPISVKITIAKLIRDYKAGDVVKQRGKFILAGPFVTEEEAWNHLVVYKSLSL